MNLEDYALTVEDVNKYIKNIFDNDENLQNLVIKGELSNFKRHYTGHIYFTLKDENSLLKCVCFKTYALNVPKDLKDGDKVYVICSINCFPRDGVYQAYVTDIQKIGLGGLYNKYLELKDKLEKEGLFDKSLKKPIPKYPTTIGVLTSKTGSVIKDIINVATRRNPDVNIKLISVPVQGPDAHSKIVEAIELANKHNICDTLILARGGGSIEDLWPFNEVDVAYAIAKSDIPVISAVGHETDFTIADFVADLRAPTPSAAAELAVPDIFQTRLHITDLQNKLKKSLVKKLELSQLKLSKILNSIVFKNPYKILDDKTMALGYLNEKMVNGINNIVENKTTNLDKMKVQLQALSPLNTLKRGYCVIQKGGKVVKSVSSLSIEDNIDIVFDDGKAVANIKEIGK